MVGDGRRLSRQLPGTCCNAMSGRSEFECLRSTRERPGLPSCRGMPSPAATSLSEPGRRPYHPWFGRDTPVIVTHVSTDIDIAVADDRVEWDEALTSFSGS